MAVVPSWYRIATDPGVLRRAALTSVGVGTILTVANNLDAMATGEMAESRILAIGINYLIPFIVSLASSVLALRVERRDRGQTTHLLEREIAAIERFPGQNPNPVLRVDGEGRLIYANDASRPVREALGAEVGDRLTDPWLDCLRAAASSDAPVRFEVEHGRQTFAILAVWVADLGVYNLYGTDITGSKVVERFPDRNPNPVLRLSPDGRLQYANAASQPITRALGITAGDLVPTELMARIRTSLVDPDGPPPEVSGEGLLFQLRPVEVPEFEFINVYGVDITAARQVEELSEANEKLLLSILPPSIAERLRGGETVIADRFDDMAVLFADIVGFTKLSSDLTPIEVIELLNEVFRMCDELAEQYGLEKIKTVGDAYMVVGGVGLGDRGDGDGPRRHADDVADMGLAMLAGLARFREQGGIPVEVRVGMNVGPAVAGVIGLKKFIYDVWGDTVNTASRMESTGVPGRIQVTRETYERLRDAFEFERRGVVDVKGKGRVETWFLVGRRSAVGAEGVAPSGQATR
ncbi:MAG TPA: nitrate/nitrite transporter NrtS [Candidatus Deferrimicrobiaceae bacterium]|nr:nitrate/nitrite transporter NrtS [Candidatus Deferrimicrobiaceae bacterium]